MDVRIEYRIGGRAVGRDEFFGDLDARICDTTVVEVRARLRQVECPAHGCRVGVRRLRLTASGVDVELSGCCEEALTRARDALR
jgi:hypothetical protein